MNRRTLAIAALAGALAFGAAPALADCPAGCDDGNSCTDDICDPQLGCVHSNNTLPCTDGNACTTNDACNGGVCVGGDRAPGCTACNAVAVLPAAGATVHGTTSGTSNLSGTCGTTGASPERVFRWTPSTSGVATFRTCGLGTLFDSVVYVRKSKCSNGQEQICNDDGPCASGTSGNEASSATLGVTAGTSYYIVVDGWNGAQGPFELTVEAPSVCGNGVREGAEECDGADASGCATGACTASCTCTTPPGGLPDLSSEITDWFFDFDASVAWGDVAEGCAEAATGVDLLRLGVKSRNVGTADFVIGPPGCPSPCTDHPLEVCGNPSFICSPAQGHNHGHYTDYARYELLDETGQTVVVGHKQGFCLKDGYDAGPCPNYQFDCNNQGISKGCADLYESTLGCQYLDITGVPAGNYTLRAVVDPFDRISELTKTNNVSTVSVTIPPHACSAPAVIPPGGGTFTGTTAGTSTLTGGCGASTNVSPETVFAWTPGASGTATIDTCDAAATAFDTVLYVREAACRGGAQLACNDDTTGCNTAAGEKGSRVTLPVTAGQTYFLVVDGANGAAGAFRLNVSGPAPPPACADGVDNDGDGSVDFPADPGCTSAADDSEQAECSDGIDNDGDGAFDYQGDNGCSSANDVSELPDCADGIDNDGDGKVDFPADPGCDGSGPFARENPECSDGVDNDGDGKVDFPADTSCASASGPSEKGGICGLLGVEALLPALLAVRGRRTRRTAS